jgi:membrane-bound ClpP family serine protease
MQPDGMVKIRGELWSARSISGNIAGGTKIVVIARNGLKLSVRPVESRSSLPGVLK